MAAQRGDAGTDRQLSAQRHLVRVPPGGAAAGAGARARFAVSGQLSVCSGQATDSWPELPHLLADDSGGALVSRPHASLLLGIVGGLLVVGGIDLATSQSPGRARSRDCRL